MKIVRALLALGVCVFLSGCANLLYKVILSTTVSHERALSAGRNEVLLNRVHAVGEGWQMKLSWDDRSLARRIWFCSGNIEDGFCLDLIPRGEPGYTSGTELTGITTRGGYYQPAGFRDYEGNRTVVLVDHGTMDFPSVRDMKLTLGKGYWSRDSIRALNGDGILVICDIEDQDWNFEIHRLTLGGRPIPKELLKPYLHGTVKVEQDGTSNGG